MSNPRLVEISGLTFGEWFVVKKSGNMKSGAALWLCKCSCGTERIVIGADLRCGKSSSCGCKGSRSTIGQRSATHRMKGSRIHNCWSNMLRRCRDITNKTYGGKGITVCQEWHTFEAFFEWSKRSGYRDDLTIERKNNSLGYNPENCTWATRKTQARNRTIVNMANDHVSWAEIAEHHGVPVGVMNNRVSAGKWSFGKSATTPVGTEHEPPQRDRRTGKFVKAKEHKWRR